MDLIISTFITDVRLPHTANIWGPKRYDALEMFKAVLESYSRIKFDKIYLLMKLDVGYTDRWDELKKFCEKLFGEHIILIENRRIEKQAEWVPIISQIANDKFVFFMQCDDHPFIDFNTNVLYEGLELMKKDSSQYTALCSSHWPEAIREAGMRGAVMDGSYLRIANNDMQPFYIWSLPLLRRVLCENAWPETLWKPGMIDCLEFTLPYYALYIPLREQMRHFDGYAHVGLRVDPEAEFPRLELPFFPVKFTEEHLRWRFRPTNVHGGSWCLSSNIKKEWEDEMVASYLDG